MRVYVHVCVCHEAHHQLFRLGAFRCEGGELRGIKGVDGKDFHMCANFTYFVVFLDVSIFCSFRYFVKPLPTDFANDSYCTQIVNAWRTRTSANVFFVLLGQLESIADGKQKY